MAIGEYGADTYAMDAYMKAEDNQSRITALAERLMKLELRIALSEVPTEVRYVVAHPERGVVDSYASEDEARAAFNRQKNGLHSLAFAVRRESGDEWMVLASITRL